jgi:uroporphyrinogen-III decarboxylase
MKPKDRVIAALEQRQPDRVPVGELAADYDITERVLGRQTYYRSKWREYNALWQGKRDEIVASYVRDIVDLVRALDWDFVGVPLVPSAQERYEKPQFLDKYTWRDKSGRVMRYSPVSEGHAMAIEFPDLSEEDIVVPDEPVRLDWSELEAIAGVAHELGDSHFVIARIDGGSFPWDTTVGLEEFLIRMIQQPAFVRKAIEAGTRVAEAQARAAIELGCAAVSTGEDYADNRSPIMGPAKFREFCLPSLQRAVKATHEAGGYFVKHSDGNHWAILDDFVQAGVEGWQGIQHRASAMELGRLKAEYGDKLCLFGGVECDTLVDGTPDEVRAEVLDALRKAGHGGGLCLCSGNTLMVGVQYENYKAMLETAARYGNYPLHLPAS